VAAATDRSLLARGPLWKTFLVFLVPMLISNVLQVLSGTINNAYLGRMIGVDALAAVSGFFPVLFFFMSFIMGFGAGASIVIGQAYGARESEKVKAVAGTVLSFGILAGVGVAIVGVFFARDVLMLVGTPQNIFADALAYGRVMLVACPLLFVFILSTQLPRGVGDTMTPLIALIVATAVGLVITPALIRGWGGLPQLGVVSAAAAGVLSWVVTLAWLAWHLRRKNHALAPDAVFLRHFRINGAILKTVLRIGLPTGVQMVLIAMAEAIMLSFVNVYGSSATAAYGTVSQVVSYVQFPAMSVAITASVFASQAIGSGNLHRLGDIVRTAIGLSLTLTGSLALLMYVFSRPLVGLFVTDPAVVELAQSLLHINLWSYILFGIAGVFAAVMRASGTVAAPTAISIFSVVVIEVSVAYVLSARVGIHGIWIAYPVAFMCMLAMQASYYRFVWRKKTISRLI